MHRPKDLMALKELLKVDIYEDFKEMVSEIQLRESSDFYANCSNFKPYHFYNQIRKLMIIFFVLPFPQRVNFLELWVKCF
jgi:hypothetical protein